MKRQWLLRTTLLVWVVLTTAACGGSNPGDDDPHGGPDAGSQDSGTPDGSTDAGLPDSGTPNDNTDAGLPDSGTEDGGTEDGGTDDGGTDAGPQDGGTSDGGTDGGSHPLPTDPNDPNNSLKDTDCDGLSDADEFATDRGNGMKTHPGVADTDGDGLTDGLELSIDTRVPTTTCVLPQDADALLRTSPVIADTDGDGLSDGLEDKNKNGGVSGDETHPLRRDTDCDGLIDGPSTASALGEDENANGIAEPSETHPLGFDTDGDGLSDGLEKGVTVNADPEQCTGTFIPDEDPNTTTDPTNPDTDGDGVSDGAEDSNQNGQVDPGELNPQIPDVTGPAAQVCPADKLRTVSFHSQPGLDLALALPPSFTELTPVMVGGEAEGLVGYDSTSQVAFLAFHRTAPAGATDPLGDEEALRPAIASQGALSNRTAQLFATWEGFPAVQALYDQQGSTEDLKRRTDALVDALVPGSTGRLSPSPAGLTGPFRLETLFVHRSNQSVAVLIAVVPLANVTGPHRSTPTAFTAKDLSRGSALAQLGEPTVAQCELFQLDTVQVDFLFVVDDSGSMQSSQSALAVAAQSAVDALNASSLDWRMAMVTTNYHLTDGRANTGRLRHFTRNVNNLKAWLTANSVCSAGVCSGVPTEPAPATCPSDTSQGANGGCWVGIAGTGNEGLLGAARLAINNLTPGTPPAGTESPTLVRQDAMLVVVLLGDADDQTSGYTSAIQNCGSGGTVDRAGSGCETVQNFINFFGVRGSASPPTNETGQLITVHGIVCPAGSACGCSASSGTCDLNNNTREFNPQPSLGSPQRHAQVVNASGGVLGSIVDSDAIIASMEAIIADTIGTAGYQTLRPPIGASLKVAVADVQDPAACTANDIPRSTVNGFDFDGRARTLSLFGACRPASESTQAAVSYRYWVDTVQQPNGAIPCVEDPNYSPTEPDHCLGPLLSCNATGDQCVCYPNCGGACGAGTQCDMSACTCEPIID